MARQSKHRAAFKVRAGGLHAWARTQGWSGSDSETLPDGYKHKAANSDNPHVQKMGQFALNSKKWKH